MQQVNRIPFIARLFAALILGAGLSVPAVSHADPAFEPSLFHVSINLGGAVRSSTDLFSRDTLSFGSNDVALTGRAGSHERQLPDSLRFAGLAGTLNLAIDSSNGTPLVEGIELAPREILRIVADDSGGIRGLHGQISIRLDF